MWGCLFRTFSNHWIVQYPNSLKCHFSWISCLKQLTMYVPISWQLPNTSVKATCGTLWPSRSQRRDFAAFMVCKLGPESLITGATMVLLFVHTCIIIVCVEVGSTCSIDRLDFTQKRNLHLGLCYCCLKTSLIQVQLSDGVHMAAVSCKCFE